MQSHSFILLQKFGLLFFHSRVFYLHVDRANGNIIPMFVFIVLIYFNPAN